MGVMIEQYRAWIGAHNSIAKTKEDNSHLEGIISNTMPILILLYHSVYLIGYIVYVALLRMANDVEENPGPTVYDIIYPSGKPCVAMSLTVNL